jgi:hypothetical protein
VGGAHTTVGCDDARGTEPEVADGGRPALKIAASCRKASRCAPPMILNVTTGTGCRRACASSRAAMGASVNTAVKAGAQIPHLPLGDDSSPCGR